MELKDILEGIRETAFDWLAEIDVTTRAPDGDQPLHIAVVQSNPEYVQALLAHGADPRSTGDMGCTPLHYAATRGSRAIVEMLLAAGASPLERDEFGRSPIDNCQSEELRALMSGQPPVALRESGCRSEDHEPSEKITQ